MNKEQRTAAQRCGACGDEMPVMAPHDCTACPEHTDPSAGPIDAQHHDPSDHVDDEGNEAPEECSCPVN